jgi:hypothetical protein
MARRWLSELVSHQEVLEEFGYRYQVSDRIRKLHDGRIAISTHGKSVKSGNLNCDLLIVDEAHRAKNEGSVFAQQLIKKQEEIGAVLILTATPFSIAPAELSRMLNLVGATSDVADIIGKAGKALQTLWNGEFAGLEFAQELSTACSAAIEAIGPYVIRHGVATLPDDEQGLFGDTEVLPFESRAATPRQLEILMRADRIFMLGKRTRAWSMTRTNDPRFHVGWRQLQKDLDTVDTDGTQAPDEREAQQRHIQRARALLSKEVDHPKMLVTEERVLSIVRTGERVVLFCDHHETARELALHLGKRLREQLPLEKATLPGWAARYPYASQLKAEGSFQEKARAGFLSWLVSEGMSAQITSWLPRRARNAQEWATMLAATAPRPSVSQRQPTTIASEVEYLWNRIRESSSSRTLFAMEGAALPGSVLAAQRIVAVTDPPAGIDEKTHAIFHPGSPDTVLSLFNSPFGPDVLVVTDAFSEGFDLHRYCRHIIHYELDPSPMRTIQRNGRLRRVDCWAAKTGKPLFIGYPVFRGTRDERLVAIMQRRLTQFDLLLGGIGGDIQTEATDLESLRRQEEVLDVVRKRLAKRTRSLCVV